MATNTNEHWTDAELARAVEAYVFLLQAERSGLNVAGDAIAGLLLSGHLQSRNEGSIRYRMRNISAVVREMGGPTVSSYSPAEQVGRNVRRRLRAMLASNFHLQRILEERATPAPTMQELDRTIALSQLEELRRQVSELERGIIGMGHNRPPEPLSADGMDRADFEQAREAISKLEHQVKLSQPDIEVVAEHSNRLLLFGAKVARWVGERATRVVDATLVLAAPILLAKAIRPMVWTRRAVSAFSLASAHEEFGRGTTSFERGVVLALGEESTINVGHEKLAQMDSIFAIAKSDDLASSTISVYLGEQKIKILVAPDIYDTLNRMRDLSAGKV